MGSSNFTCCSINSHQTVYHEYSSLQLAFGQELNIFHLRIFSCVVYVALAQYTKMGPHRRLGIFFSYESPIIRYLEPKTGDIFTGRLPTAIAIR